MRTRDVVDLGVRDVGAQVQAGRAQAAGQAPPTADLAEHVPAGPAPAAGSQMRRGSGQGPCAPLACDVAALAIKGMSTTRRSFITVLFRCSLGSRRHTIATSDGSNSQKF